MPCGEGTRGRRWKVGRFYVFLFPDYSLMIVCDEPVGPIFPATHMNFTEQALFGSLVRGPLLVGDLPEAARFPHLDLMVPGEAEPLNLEQKLGHLYEDACSITLMRRHRRFLNLSVLTAGAGAGSRWMNAQRTFRQARASKSSPSRSGRLPWTYSRGSRWSPGLRKCKWSAA
jgi:hypothetical protein